MSSSPEGQPLEIIVSVPWSVLVRHRYEDTPEERKAVIEAARDAAMAKVVELNLDAKASRHATDDGGNSELLVTHSRIPFGDVEPTPAVKERVRLVAAMAAHGASMNELYRIANEGTDTKTLVEHESELIENHGWIGVDLDGTLAEYHGWKGPEHIGDPVPEMLDRVRKWIGRGKRVKVFTARAADPLCFPHIQAWLAKHGLGHLEITNVKDFAMVELYDDRCRQVEPNTGRIIG